MINREKVMRGDTPGSDELNGEPVIFPQDLQARISSQETQQQRARATNEEKVQVQTTQYGKSNILIGTNKDG